MAARPAATAVPGDLFDQLDPAGQQILGQDDTHTYLSQLDPGVYLSDPQGHAQLVGTNDRAMAVLDLGGLVEVGGVHVTSPEVLEQLADRLRMLAGRLRDRDGQLSPPNTLEAS